MDERVEGPLGLEILSKGSNPTIDIVAVHGLGANPAWAWVWKDGESKINWLKDANLLPQKIPEARIMTFNYESKWHTNAPKQRHSLCADQLLTALDNERKEGQAYTHRPLLFIGHSFGGIVIEQAIVTANVPGGPFHYLVASTVGIVFLGTPHRGTDAAKWGELLAYTGQLFGFSTEQSILRCLREDSETLQDLLDTFAIWLFDNAVRVFCFFEQHETDYGRRVGGFIRWKALVVGERSACISGHRKFGLPTDHIKINKFSGPEDPSYKAVSPIIADMARNTRPLSQEILECLQSLRPTNAQDHLQTILRSSGGRIEGTCEWILSRQEFTNWANTRNKESSQLLRIIGGPGIGKTMMSTFLVNKLQERIEDSPPLIAYYFYDNKDEERNNASALLRSLISQILKRRPRLLERIRDDVKILKDRLRENFDALWRIFKSMLADENAGKIYILIDALDECTKSSRANLLRALSELFKRPPSCNYKVILTCRPETDIQQVFLSLGTQLNMDSSTIGNDLTKFIEIKVDELSKVKKYSPSLAKDVGSAINKKSDGTFLWASLVLDELFKTTLKSVVRTKLKTLPTNLNEVFDRILRNIDQESVNTATKVLQLILIASRPLTVRELAVACFFTYAEWEEDHLPSEEMIDDQQDDYEICGPLLYRDARNDTIHFVHQSVKDYLLGQHLRSSAELGRYHIIGEKANLVLFGSCWNYFEMREFEQGSRIVQREPDGQLVHRSTANMNSKAMALLPYATSHYWEHALASGHSWSASIWNSSKFNSLPTLRDWLFLQSALKGDELVIGYLLDNGVDVTTKNSDGETALHFLAGMGNESRVQLLLNRGADVMARDVRGRTALHWAVKIGNEGTARHLIAHNAGACLEIRDIYGWTALYLAVRIAEWRFDAGEAMVKLLLHSRADPNIGSESGSTALQEAVEYGRFPLVKVLLDHGADATAIQEFETTSSTLEAAKSSPSEAVALRLLEIKSKSIKLGKLEEVRAAKIHTSGPKSSDLTVEETEILLKEFEVVEEGALLQNWTEIRAGLSKVMLIPAERSRLRKLLQLYTIIYNYCTNRRPFWHLSHPFSHQLYIGATLYQYLIRYIRKHLQDIASAAKRQDDRSFLKFYEKELNDYSSAATQIKISLQYLETHYILRKQREGFAIQKVWDLFLVLWREQIVMKNRELLISAIFAVFSKQRDGVPGDMSQIKVVLDSFIQLETPPKRYDKEPSLFSYVSTFEAPFLEATTEYYKIRSKDIPAQQTPTNYLKMARKWLADERNMAELYLPARTLQPLMRTCFNCLVTAHSQYLSSHLDENDLEDMAKEFQVGQPEPKQVQNVSEIGENTKVQSQAYELDRFLQEEDLSKMWNEL